MNAAQDDGFQSDFQSDFLRAVYGVSEAPTALAALTGQPGFKVYRNTILKASVDALAANYPSIVRLVGEEWFRSAALIHACAEPPESVCLIEYGWRFPAFIAGFAPAAELPYLSDVARLDRCWTECHIAADDEALEASALADIPETALPEINLRPRASVRWAWFSEHPAYSIWQANREQRKAADDLPWRSEGALLRRVDGEVVWQAAGEGMCAFLDACAAGDNLQSAAGRALQADPQTDVALVLGTLIGAGVFVAMPAAPNLNSSEH